MLLTLLLFAGNAHGAQGLLPSFAEVRDAHLASDGRLLDRSGALLQEQRLSLNGRALEWVPLAEVSPALRDAVLQVEDRRFLEHGGVDWRAFAGAAWQRLAYGSQRGASTITMQTVNFLETSRSRGRRSLWGKLRQARLAWELEKSWKKEEILEAYLNLVSFRGEHRGLLTASRALFGKEPHGLDLRESYLLATLLRAPGMPPAAAAARLCRQADAFSSLGSCPSLTAFAEGVLGRPRSPLARATLAPHLARRLLSREHPEVRSSLSLPLQRFAAGAVLDQLKALRAQNARDAAVLVADNRTGEILAYVGSSGELSAAAEVDMVQSRRQAGSTLKPFLYALAFNNGYLNPDSWLLDEPFEIGLDRGSYEPDNYDHSFHGPVTAKEALASSLNIPAVRLVDLIGVDPFQALLDSLGFRSLREGEHYGPSLALGTADVTLFDLVQAYRALANGGVWSPLRYTPGAGSEPGRRLLSRKTAGQIAGILSDRGFRALTFGWDSLLATPYPSAVKTGTSKDMRDNWCIGFTRDFTVGVWVGNSGGEAMWQVSGVSGAAPVWRALMDRLHRNHKPAAFPSLASTPPVFERGRFGRILYPAAGAVLAVDPDIPERNQRIAFEAEGGGRLYLDGELVQDSLWKPVKGRHHLKLSSATGAELDSLSFDVR